jgi:hypothetical protein
MGTEIAKAVREEFAREVRKELVQFVAVETPNIPAGDCLFNWQIGPGMNAYIYLFTSPKYNQDRFAVEPACSAGEFPLQMPREPSFEAQGAVRFRLPQLYKDQWPKKNWEPMWEVGPHDSPRDAIGRTVMHIKTGELPNAKDEGLLPVEQAIQYVEPQVHDAINKIKKFGIPFFYKYAQRNSKKV